MQNTAIKLNDLEIFIAVVEAGSISRAAEMLDIPKSNVSRHLRQLEEGLGIRLLERTTRSQALTQAGERFYEGSQQLLLELESMCADVVGDDREIKGRLSVFTPEDVLRPLLSHQLRGFNKKYPNLEFEFLSGALSPDLLHDRLDLIIHPDTPQDSSFIGVKLFEVATNFFASPEYLANVTLPQHPKELNNYQCIAELRQDRQLRPWIYSDGQKTGTVKISPHYRCDSLPLVRELAECGYGIAILPVFVCEEAVAQHRLVRVLPEHYQANHTVYGIYSSRRLVSRKLELFLAFLIEAFPPNL